jgi:hypothetical protein
VVAMKAVKISVMRKYLFTIVCLLSLPKKIGLMNRVENLHFSD